MAGMGPQLEGLLGTDLGKRAARAEGRRVHFTGDGGSEDDDEDENNGGSEAGRAKQPRFPKGKKQRAASASGADDMEMGVVAGEEEGPIRDFDPDVAAKQRAKRRKEIAVDLQTNEDTSVPDDIAGAEEELEAPSEDEAAEIEPFNLNKEREEGYFDAEGNYVEYKVDRDVNDAWLDSVEVDTSLAKKAAARAAAQDVAEEELSAEEVAATKRRIATALEPRETPRCELAQVLQALKRLGGPRSGSGRGRGKAERLHMSEAQKARFDQLTDDAIKLMDRGEYGVYSEKRETFLREAEGYEALARARAGPVDSKDDMFGDDDNDNDGDTKVAALAPQPSSSEMSKPSQAKRAPLQRAAMDAPVDAGRAGVDGTSTSSTVPQSSNGQSSGAPPSEGSGYVLDESSGYYFNAAVGYYYDASSSLFCSAATGLWYRYDEDTSTYMESTAANAHCDRDAAAAAEAGRSDGGGDGGRATTMTKKKARAAKGGKSSPSAGAAEGAAATSKSARKAGPAKKWAPSSSVRLGSARLVSSLSSASSGDAEGALADVEAAVLTLERFALSLRRRQRGGRPSDTGAFRDQLRVLGLGIREVAGDGNCFFRAVADQLEGSEDGHSKYRQDTVDFMEANREQFEPFVEDDEPFDKYCKSMREDGAWAGHMELQALSLLRKCNICIHQIKPRAPDLNTWEALTLWPAEVSPLEHTQFRSSSGTDNSPSGLEIVAALPEYTEVHLITEQLAYHDNEHYNSIRKLGDDSSVAAEDILIEADVLESTKQSTDKVMKGIRVSKVKKVAEVGRRKSDCKGEAKQSEATSVDCHLHAVEAMGQPLGDDRESREGNFSATQLVQVDEGVEAPRAAEAGNEKEAARNKACPCGSRKKYKACCGSAQAKGLLSKSGAGVSNKERKQQARAQKEGFTDNSKGKTVKTSEPLDVGSLTI
eukprot:SM000080S22934  [mRNA]  locus=s80:259401:265942:+ [translate_table: standard]